ncbi:MAG: hypothetical protein WC273_00800 [Dehalococcoidia bacterium]
MYWKRTGLVKPLALASAAGLIAAATITAIPRPVEAGQPQAAVTVSACDAGGGAFRIDVAWDNVRATGGYVTGYDPQPGAQVLFDSFAVKGTRHGSASVTATSASGLLTWVDVFLVAGDRPAYETQPLPVSPAPCTP